MQKLWLNASFQDSGQRFTVGLRLLRESGDAGLSIPYPFWVPYFMSMYKIGEPKRGVGYGGLGKTGTTGSNMKHCAVSE